MPNLTDLKSVITLVPQAQGSIAYGEAGPAPGMPAVKVTGAGARFDAGDAYQFTGTTAFSVECFFKLEAFTTGTPRLITTEYTNVTDSGWSIEFAGPTGAALFVRRVNGAGVFCSLGTFVPGRWHHVVGTYDGATMRGYLDGVLMGTETSTGSIPSGTTTLRIGAYNSSLNSINGWLSSLAIYGAALTQAEVQARWRAGRRRAA